MLEVSDKTLESFVDSFLNNMLFGDLPTDQLEDLKTFLADYLKKLYQDRPDDIIKLIDQVESINPFMIKLALGYGILEDDVVDLVKVMFMKINEFFYKKGSFEVLKYISNVLRYYGITSYIKKVIYDKRTDSWVLEDVFDGTRESTKIEEFLTPGHLITKKEYALNTFADNYNTIVIYIRMELSAKVDDKMQHPVALLHAYAITLHKNDILQFYINGNVYDLTLKKFLFFLQYFYLKYIKMRNPDFELDESGLEMWSLFITDPDDMGIAADLLQSLLAGEFNNRDGIAYFLRVSSRLLNKYKIKTKPLTLNEISARAYGINDQLATAIDQMKTTDEYIKNLSITLLYVETYLNKLSTETQLQEAIKNTIRYLINFIAFSIILDSLNAIKNLIFKFKKYFLPIYTQFFFEIIKSFKIKNEFYRIYLKEFYKILLRVRNSDLIKIWDKQELEIRITQEDINEVLDSIHTLLNIDLKDDIGISDEFLNTLDINKYGVIKTRDSQSSNLNKYQKDKINVIDMIAAVIKSVYKDDLEIVDKINLFLESSGSSIIELLDEQYLDVDIWQRDSNKVTDAISAILVSVPKDSLEFKDKIKLFLEHIKSSIIKLNDQQYIDIGMWQRNENKILDLVTAIPTPVPKDSLEFKDKLFTVLDANILENIDLQDKPITGVGAQWYDSYKITDTTNNVIDSSPKEMLNISDSWIINLYLTFNSITKTNDSNTVTIIRNQFDQTEILDSVIITIN